MLRRLNVTARIWLSIGIFVLGYVFSTACAQVQGLSAERSLRTAVAALFPAAQRSQETETLFQRSVNGFSNAVLVQDASSLDRAAQDGEQVLDTLRKLASIPDLPPERSEAARRQTASIEQFLRDARATYGAVLANPGNMTPETERKMRTLAASTDALKRELAQTRDQFARDLEERLSSLAASSVKQRWLAIALFVGTLLAAAALVNLTIRRGIIGPVLRVIQGVQQAADSAAHNSSRMAESGETVARDAHEQAACIQQTSASLEEISATTKENADRANHADALMRGAGETVERAMQAMNDLASSMQDISQSSAQVSAVLKSIDEIAFHTNILALNAAVEAARAGEAGAGFSVVAEEVRSLAHRAADAARRSSDIVDKTASDVSRGVELLSVTQGTFEQVASSIASGGRVVTEIAASSDEQARGINQIGQAITRIEAVTQSNAANAQHTAEAASAMAKDAETTRHHLDELMAVIGSQGAATAPRG